MKGCDRCFVEPNKAVIVSEIYECVNLLDYAHDHKLYSQFRTCFTIEHLKIVKSFEKYE